MDEAFVEIAQRGRAPELRFRFAGPCVEGRCRNWEHDGCSVVERALARGPEPPFGALPACGVRPDCRWFAQQGADACVVCPEVVRGPEPLYAPSDWSSGREVAIMKCRDRGRRRVLRRALSSCGTPSKLLHAMSCPWSDPMAISWGSVDRISLILTMPEICLPLAKHRCLMQCDQHLDDARRAPQRLQGFPNHRTDHSIPIGALHRIAWCRRGNEEVTDCDCTVLDTDLA